MPKTQALNACVVARCRTLLRDAGYVLIAAGSGMSIDAGIDYTDTAFFERRFPAMARRGFRMQYELIGYQQWTEALKWGFLAEHVFAVRWETPPHPVYTDLLKLVNEKDHFVLTTNVDGMFAKSGFAEDRIYTPQGSYALYQCLKPCTTETWPLEPVIERIRPNINTCTQEITDPGVIPFCPHCDGPVFMNVRGGRWFIEEPYVAQKSRFFDWIEKTAEGPLVILEIGSGFNTPRVIRWPMEHITRHHVNAHLIRVNVEHPEAPSLLEAKATSIQARAIEWVNALRRS